MSSVEAEVTSGVLLVDTSNCSHLACSGGRSMWSSLPPLAAIEKQDEQDNYPVDNATTVLRHVHRLQHADEHGQAYGARGHAQVVSSTTGYVHAPDDNGGDGLEEIRVADAQRRRPPIADQRDAGESGEHTAEHVEDNGRSSNVDARQVAGPGVVAHRVDPAPERGEAEDEADQQYYPKPEAQVGRYPEQPAHHRPAHRRRRARRAGIAGEPVAEA